MAAGAVRLEVVAAMEAAELVAVVPKVVEASPLAFELLLGSGSASLECEFECL